MRKSRRNLIAGAIVLAAGAYYLSGRKRGPCGFGLKYAERLTGGADAAEALPLVIFLHPRGARPKDFTGFANRIKGKARVLFPGGPFIGKSGLHSWATHGAATKDQEKLGDDMRVSGKALARFIAEAQRCYATVGAPVVTGSSQGGNMTYYMVSQYPDLVRGGVAIAGWVPTKYWSSQMAQTFGAHGTQDTTVNYARTADYWAKMKAAGAHLVTKTYPVGHTTSGMGGWWGARVNDLLGATA